MKKTLNTLLAGIILNCGTTFGEVPKGKTYDLPNNYCARYIKLSAKDLFQKDYPSSDSWNLRHDTKIIARDRLGMGDEKLNELIESGQLNPGMIFGIYNPRSKFNEAKDKKGLPVEYTYVALFLGQENGTNYVAHQLGSRQITKEPTSEIFRRGYKIKEVLDTKNDSSS